MQAVTMYSKATCPYCIRAKQLLASKGVRDLNDIDINQQPEQRERMIARTGRYTVPQIFIGDTHVGGCDDLMALEQRGELDALLAG